MEALIPFSSSGPFGGQDWAVDVSISQNIGTFRLVRTDNTGTSVTTGIACDLKIHCPNGGVVSITNSTSTGTGATNTGNYENTVLTQVDGRVGIGTENPTVLLDVAGTFNCTGDFRINGVELGKTYETTSTSSQSTSSSSFSNVLSLNVSAGKYYVVFSATFGSSSMASPQYYALFVAGNQVAHSERQVYGAAGGYRYNVHLQEIVTVSTTTNLAVRFRSGGGTNTCFQRSLFAI